MNTDHYAIEIEWDDLDEIFIARVPDLPGCAAHGDTREEALAEAEFAINFWLDVAKERGLKPPAPRLYTHA
jgi:predicted RNase H-like HicB family nuclease